jgi:UDP-3-O-[3-hydroxymyristoyl] glucosamine N-acyltransferase
MSIEIPSEQYFLNDLIHQYFPSINVTHAKTKHAVQETTYSNSYLQTATHDTNLLTRLQGSTLSIIIPSNSILHFDKDGKLVLDEVNYPWDFLKVIQQVLNDEVTSTKISSNAKISKTSIIEGPCIIEKGVVIDDFCKIKGPAYIGENSFIGMGSLVRNSILECNTRIGFNCEIGKILFCWK